MPHTPRSVKTEHTGAVRNSAIKLTPRLQQIRDIATMMHANGLAEQAPAFVLTSAILYEMKLEDHPAAAASVVEALTLGELGSDIDRLVLAVARAFEFQGRRLKSKKIHEVVQRCVALTMLLAPAEGAAT